MTGCCDNCYHCLPVGEGDYICGVDTAILISEDYAQTDEFYCCNGDEFDEK